MNRPIVKSNRVEKLQRLLAQAGMDKATPQDVRRLMAATQLAQEVGSERIPVRIVREMLSEFIGALKDLKHDFSGQIDTLVTQTREALKNTQAKTDTRLKALDTRITELDVDGRIKRAIKPLSALIQDVRASIPSLAGVEYSVERLDRRVTSLENRPAPKPPEKPDLTPLVRRIQQLEDRPVAVQRTFLGGGRPVHVPLVDVFTGDGATKTFYLTKAPRDLRTIKAWGSDFPHIMTEGASRGFTVTGKLLTLNSDIDAPTNGGTLVAEYYV